VTDLSWLGPPINVTELFGRQHDAFLSLLQDLTDDDWSRPTACPGWSVKDIAAHVLGDHLGRLARHRDQYHQGPAPQPGETLPVFLDRINAEWVTAARRLSPQLLISLLSQAGSQVAEFWLSVDPDALGEAVSWAGPDPAPVWLDAARDFSEYWVHQQQICDATGHHGRTEPGFQAPVLDTFMRALPHTLRDIDAPAGTAVLMTVTGPCGGNWTCVRDTVRWRLHRRPDRKPGNGPDKAPAAAVELDADTAWRLCTRGISPQQAAVRARIDGEQALAAAALRIVSIIWTDPADQPGS